MFVHNQLKLCYGTPQQFTCTPTPLNSTQPSYAEIVRHTELEPIGGYTSSSDNSSRDVTVPLPLGLDVTVDLLVVTVILCHLDL